MLSLVKQVKLINDQILESANGIPGTSDTLKYYGLVKQVKRGAEDQNLDIETDTQVVIDDKYESFFYHKINGQITYIKVNSPGKTNLYNAKATISLICYSALKNFEEQILRGLSNVKLLTILNTDYDSYKIIAAETGKKDFDFKNYLFVVNYQILYKTDNCYELCQ